jgi:ribA/ribD-fused uncharacterized protein
MIDRHPPPSQARIDRFDATEYAFLSNFHPSPVVIRVAEETPEQIACATVEHGFQACKALDPAERRRIAAAATPGEAKRRGRRTTLRPDWEHVRDEIMRALLAQKFRLGEVLGLRLLATGDAELIEGNSWGDRYWGVVDGVGQNRLGQLLMHRRAELRTALSEQANPPPTESAARRAACLE